MLVVIVLFALQGALGVALCLLFGRYFIVGDFFCWER